MTRGSKMMRRVRRSAVESALIPRVRKRAKILAPIKGGSSHTTRARIIHLSVKLPLWDERPVKPRQKTDRPLHPRRLIPSRPANLSHTSVMFERWTRCDWTRKREERWQARVSCSNMAQGKSKGERGEGMPNETRYARTYNSGSQLPDHEGRRRGRGSALLPRIPRQNLAPDHTGGREYRESRGNLGSPYNRSPSPWFVARDDLSYDVERRTGRLSNTERRLV